MSVQEELVFNAPTVSASNPTEARLWMEQFRRQGTKIQHRPDYRHFRRRIGSNECFQHATRRPGPLLTPTHISPFRRFLFLGGAKVALGTVNSRARSWFSSIFSAGASFERSITFDTALAIVLNCSETSLAAIKPARRSAFLYSNPSARSFSSRTRCSLAGGLFCNLGLMSAAAPIAYDS